MGSSEWGQSGLVQERSSEGRDGVHMEGHRLGSREVRIWIMTCKEVSSRFEVLPKLTFLRL